MSSGSIGIFQATLKLDRVWFDGNRCPSSLASQQRDKSPRRSSGKMGSRLHFAHCSISSVSLNLSASFRSFSRVCPIICACYDRVFCPAKELLQIQPVKASPFYSSIRLRANIKCEDQTPLALPELYFNRMLRFTGIRKYELQVSKILKETTPERDQALLVEQAL